MSRVLVRSWTFVPKGNSFADISAELDVIEKPQYSPGPFTIKKLSTLILNNVDFITMEHIYIYRFGIWIYGKFHTT